MFKKKTGITLPLALYFHNDRPSPKSLDTVVSKTYPQTYYHYVKLKKTYIQELNLIKEKKIYKDNHLIVIHREKKSIDNFKEILNPLIIKQYGRSKIIFGSFT